MYGKLEITGKIKIQTGMHIGGSTEFSAIGAVDAPVMRDSYTNMPYIPGSSLKGKMRYLLQKRYGEKSVDVKISHNDDDGRILRLFGSSNDKNSEKSQKSRLYFSDCFLSNLEEMKERGIKTVTEVKFENTINRFTAVANPRQIERVIRGTEFQFSIIYNIEDEKEMEEDFKIIREGFQLLEYDYLGGHGSRGYGRIKIQDLKLEPAVGEHLDILGGLREILGAN